MEKDRISGNVRLGVIGSAGIPNRYGGFESFAEHVTPLLTSRGIQVIVTCDRARYLDDLSPDFRGAKRFFVSIPANGALSPLHDLIAFFRVYMCVDHVLVLGVSGGLFFPLFRLACEIVGCRLVVNIDGIEWRRSKFGSLKRLFLFLSDLMAQRFSHRVIYDNQALVEYVRHPSKSVCIEYSGDHALWHVPSDQNDQEFQRSYPYALTICRIEPENNCELLIEGFLKSSLQSYIFIGNWNGSAYGKSIRSRFSCEQRLTLLDPVYDVGRIFRLRSNCSYYLHGHSVGGTNPSLVEMLFFDCAIYCWDCIFNRVTTDSAAYFFSTADQLSVLLNSEETLEVTSRAALRFKYSSENIVRKLLNVFKV